MKKPEIRHQARFQILVLSFVDIQNDKQKFSAHIKEHSLHYYLFFLLKHNVLIGHASVICEREPRNHKQHDGCRILHGDKKYFARF